MSGDEVPQRNMQGLFANVKLIDKGQKFSFRKQYSVFSRGYYWNDVSSWCGDAKQRHSSCYENKTTLLCPI
jgi:hypothetical protein